MGKILLTIAFLITSCLLFSQTRFGIRGGLNFANIESQEETIDAGIIPSYITSFHFGGFAEIEFNSKYYLQPGLLLSGKGYKIDYSASESGYEVSLKSKVNAYTLKFL